MVPSKWHDLLKNMDAKGNFGKKMQLGIATSDLILGHSMDDWLMRTSNECDRVPSDIVQSTHLHSTTSNKLFACPTYAWLLPNQ